MLQSGGRAPISRLTLRLQLCTVHMHVCLGTALNRRTFNRLLCCGQQVGVLVPKHQLHKR